jgi:hypothetical protein
MEDHDCYAPPPYGEREPYAHDIEAIAAYVRAVAPFMDQREMPKLLDRAGSVFEVYVEQFRAPENG